MRPFCANERCFMHELEVDDDKHTAEVRLPSGHTRTYSRDWLVVKKDLRKYPLCDACGNVLAVVRGDGESLRPQAGIRLNGALLDPAGNVLQTYQPEAPADIDEPQTEH